MSSKLIINKRYPRGFYYPKGVGFWTGHVNMPLYNYTTTTYAGKVPREFKDLIDSDAIDNDVCEIMKTFSCTQGMLDQWVDEEIASGEIDFEMDDYYQDKYGGLPEKKDEDDNAYDRETVYKTSKEMMFWKNIGIDGANEVAQDEFIKQLWSTIVNTNVTIWLSIVQNPVLLERYKGRLIDFIVTVDVYWMEELIPFLEELCGKSFADVEKVKGE